jgi:hypothetical protein
MLLPKSIPKLRSTSRPTMKKKTRSSRKFMETGSSEATI